MIHAVAVRFQLLPDVIDISFVLVLSGLGGLVATLVAAALRIDADRLARLVVLGNVFGAVGGTVLLILAALGLISRTCAESRSIHPG
jgi:hypothetical protein